MPIFHHKQILSDRITQMLATPGDLLRDNYVVPALEQIDQSHPFPLNLVKNEEAVRIWARSVARDPTMAALVCKVPLQYTKHSTTRSLWKKLGEYKPKREHGLIKAIWENMQYVREEIALIHATHLASRHVCDASCTLYMPPPLAIAEEAAAPAAAPPPAEADDAEEEEHAAAPPPVEADDAEEEEHAAAPADSPAQLYVIDPVPEWRHGLYYMDASDCTQAAQVSAAELALLRELLAPRSSVPCHDAAAESAAPPILPAEADDDAEEEDATSAAPPRWNRLHIGPHPDCLAEEVRCRNCAAAAAPCDDCAQVERFNRI